MDPELVDLEGQRRRTGCTGGGGGARQTRRHELVDGRVRCLVEVERDGVEVPPVDRRLGCDGGPQRGQILRQIVLTGKGVTGDVVPEMKTDAARAGADASGGAHQRAGVVVHGARVTDVLEMLLPSDHGQAVGLVHDRDPPIRGVEVLDGGEGAVDEGQPAFAVAHRGGVPVIVREVHCRGGEGDGARRDVQMRAHAALEQALHRDAKRPVVHVRRAVDHPYQLVLGGLAWGAVRAAVAGFRVRVLGARRAVVAPSSDGGGVVAAEGRHRATVPCPGEEVAEPVRRWHGRMLHTEPSVELPEVDLVPDRNEAARDGCGIDRDRRGRVGAPGAGQAGGRAKGERAGDDGPCRPPEQTRRAHQVRRCFRADRRYRRAVDTASKRVTSGRTIARPTSQGRSAPDVAPAQMMQQRREAGHVEGKVVQVIVEQQDRSRSKQVRQQTEIVISTIAEQGDDRVVAARRRVREHFEAIGPAHDRHAIGLAGPGRGAIDLADRDLDLAPGKQRAQTLRRGDREIDRTGLYEQDRPYGVVAKRKQKGEGAP